MDSSALRVCALALLQRRLALGDAPTQRDDLAHRLTLLRMLLEQPTLALTLVVEVGPQRCAFGSAVDAGGLLAREHPQTAFGGVDTAGQVL